MGEIWTILITGALASAAPLVLAGLGEAVLERSGGGYNLGIEGTMLCGALAGVLGSAAAGPWAGLVAGAAAGVVFGALYAAGCGAGIDPVLVGIALTVLGTGLSTYLSEIVNPPGATALSAGTLPAGAGVWLAAAAAVLIWWLLRGTRFGLRLRACADEVAPTRGIAVARYRAVAALIAGAGAGLGGAVFALASIGTFTPLMTAGSGFIALAVVIIARQSALGVPAAAVLFSVFDSLALLAQTRDLGLPVEAYQAVPYVLTIVLLCLRARQRSRPPGRVPAKGGQRG